MLSAPSNRSYSAIAGAISFAAVAGYLRDWLFITLALGHYGPSHPGKLVGERDRRDFDRPPVHQRCQPGPVLGAVLSHEADDGERASAEQGSQIAVAGLGDIAEPFPSAARILLGRKPDLGGEIPPAAEGSRVGDAGDKRGCERRPHAGNGVEPFAELA